VPDIKGCYRESASIAVAGSIIVILTHETLILMITLWFGYTKHWRMRSPLVATLYQDGVLFYAFIVAISIFNLVVAVSWSAEYIDLLNSLQRILHSVLASRVILDIRESDCFEPEEEEDASFISSLRFHG